MSEVRIERQFKAPPQRLFAFLSEPANIVKWWGPEGMSVPQAQMNFTQTGPWSSVMMNGEGQRYKVTGEVVAVDPPNSIELTWAWHDASDLRGHESRVRLQVHPTDTGGSLLILHHFNLANDESAKGHREGWESALRKLAAMDN